MEYSIIFVAPNQQIANLVIEVAEEIGEEIQVEVGDLKNGVQIAQENEGKVNVIISRGGTALAIKERVDLLPVIEIQISGFDIVQALHKAKSYNEKVGVVGFKNVIYGTKSMEEILGLDISKYELKSETINNEDLVRDKIIEAKEDGIKVIVGDTVSVKLATELNLIGILIESGKASILRGIKEAKQAARIQFENLERFNRLKAIIDFNYDGIIAIDKEQKITVFNPVAEDIFELNSEDVIGREVTEVIPNTRLDNVLEHKQNELERIQEIGNKKIATNRVPIRVNDKVVGVVATFQAVDKIQRMEQKIRDELSQKGHIAHNQLQDIVGNSEEITNCKQQANDFAAVDSTVLITGETGVGKEIFAQGIHNASLRRNEPFVAINCTTLPDNLLESELFGYVKGAFTGANRKGKLGLFEQAHGGTIFLDEIGDISLKIQARLLRVLQEQQIRKLGDEKLIPVDVRVIAATNKDLKELVAENKFRKDLYYRINVLHLKIPPLRERGNDVILLANYFIKSYNNMFNKRIKGVTNSGLQLLKNYNWPGNVRELKNLFKRIVIMSNERLITKEVIAEALELKQEEINNDDELITLNPNQKLAQLEKEIIEQVLDLEEGNKKATAERLGIGRTTLWRKIKE